MIVRTPALRFAHAPATVSTTMNANNKNLFIIRFININFNDKVSVFPSNYQIFLMICSSWIQKNKFQSRLFLLTQRFAWIFSVIRR